MGKVIHRELSKNLKANHTNKWYLHNPAAALENDTHKLLWDFVIKTDHLNSVRRLELITYDNQQQEKKRNYKIVGYDIPADHWIQLLENEKKDKYFNFDWELKNPWNMKVTLIPTVFDAFGTVPKRLVKGLEDLEIRERVETIQATTLLRTSRILGRILEIWEDLFSLKLHWNTIH